MSLMAELEESVFFMVVILPWEYNSLPVSTVIVLAELSSER